MKRETEKQEGRLFSTMSAETVIFLSLFLAIALAGFNSGNNLLYLISGIMLAGILVSFAAGYLNLSRMKVSRRLPIYVFSGQPFKMVLEILNRKKLFNSYGISIFEDAGARTIFIPLVGKKESLSRAVELCLSRRGIYTFHSVILASRFPWGLFNLKKKKEAKHELVVYPAVYEINKVITGSSRIRDEFPQFSKGPGSGLYGLREYRHGEDIANISWKLSAKMDKLIVRETEAEERRRVCVIFDNVLEGRSEADLQLFERNVSAAASLIWYLCRNNYVVKLVTRERIIGYGGGNDQMHRMLIALAIIQPINPSEKQLALDKRVLEGGTGVLIHCSDGSNGSFSGDKDIAVVISEKAGAGGA